MSSQPLHYIIICVCRLGWIYLRIFPFFHHHTFSVGFLLSSMVLLKSEFCPFSITIPLSNSFFWLLIDSVIKSDFFLYLEGLFFSKEIFLAWHILVTYFSFPSNEKLFFFLNKTESNKLKSKQNSYIERKKNESEQKVLL